MSIFTCIINLALLVQNLGKEKKCKKFVSAYFQTKQNNVKAAFKVIVTVKSSGCLQIGFGPLIIDYICNVLI